MKIHELVNRLTGFSTPIFGVSWDPPTLDVEVARRLIIFLEDKRALFYEMERQRNMDYVLVSIQEIRKRITSDLESLTTRSTELGKTLTAMRAACVRFIDRHEEASRPLMNYMGRTKAVNTEYEMKFFEGEWLSLNKEAEIEQSIALGELRSIFGLHIARMALAYGVDIEGDLQRILPAELSEE